MIDDRFENFLRRHEEQEPKSIPRELFQAVVFLKKPVEEEIDLNKLQKFLCKKKIKKIFSYPFYSEDIFMSPKEVENYIPTFLKKLIGKGNIPLESIKDNKVNYELIETGIVPLNFATLERIDEFKNFKLDV
jgi:hypothetical protein